MEFLSIDETGATLHTGRMPFTRRQQLVVGRRLRDLRLDRAWKQRDVETRARLSRGTLTAIERGTRQVTRGSLEKYAEIFHTTADAILHGETTHQRTLTADLNEEHLGIARGYMKAKRKPRQAVEVILEERTGEDLAQILLVIKELAATHPLDVLAILMAGLSRGDLLILVAERLARDPAFEALVRTQLSEPTPPPPSHK